MRYLFVILLASFSYLMSDGQGCVAIRSNGGTCTMTGSSHEKGDDWIISMNYRGYASYKHFVGTVEQKQRTEQGSEVINHVNAFDVDLIRVINPRWSIGFFMPVTGNTRSSLYEGDGIKRRTTSSFGLGDIRIAGYYWLVDPMRNTKFNVQAGLGVKFATGDYKYQDYFYKNDSTKILGPVDQSIQLGDGGTGITLETNVFYNLSPRTGFYANGYYLVNPREQNGVSTGRGSPVSANSILYGTDVMSVPDQYMVRAGADFKLNHFIFSAGLRLEAVPARDLVGGSNGFRRPGSVLSAEPVVAYKHNKMQFYLSVPYAIRRNRPQSVADILKTQKTGVFSNGDAAFADYTINLGASFSLK